jgi:transcriptional regulator with XRE-family HTH domain
MNKKITKKIPKPTFFGRNLRQLRQYKKLSQSVLAQEVGLNRNKIASYESNMVEPNASNFLKICQFLEVDPRSMLADTIKVNLPQKSTEANEKQGNASILLALINQLEIDNQEAIKIHEGYTSYYETYRNTTSTSENEAIYHTLFNLLQLLDRLIQLNTAFIKYLEGDLLNK